MKMDEITESEIKELILQFNLDKSIDALKNYYATPTTWDIIKQSRRETSHTQFLGWFFGDKELNADLNAGPIRRLIILLLKWANNQKHAYFDKELAESIYSQTFSILSYEVSTEYPINLGKTNADVPAYGAGCIDILIKCAAQVGEKSNGGDDKVRHINIVIENKIDASETTKSFDEKGNPLKNPNKGNVKTVLYQTEAYWQYISKEFKDDINIFVYLKPTDCSLVDIENAECKCNKYIQINYQELLDNILQPVSEQVDISATNKFRLKEYIKTLGKPADTDGGDEDTNKKITIMAMENNERKLLEAFFYNNEDLIRAAINALGDGELTKSLANIPSKKRSKSLYTLICGNASKEENLTMYQVLEHFIKFRLGDSVSVKEINQEIRSYVGGNRVYVSDSDIKVEYEDYKEIGKVTFDGTEIRYSKQWREGGDNPNFPRFRDGVNKKYGTKFYIEPALAF